MLPELIPTNDGTLETIVAEVDAVIRRSVTAGDPLIACEYGTVLRKRAALSGLSLAKLLYEMQQNWHFYEAAGIEDDFELFAETHMDVSPQTTRKYVRMWQAIFASEFVDDEVKIKLQSKPIGDLLLIAPAMDEGSLNQEEVNTILVAGRQKIKEVIRAARGQKTSSASAVIGAVQIKDGRHPQGTLLASQDGQTEIAGYLNMKSDIPFVQKLIERIKNAAHLLERDL